MDGVGEREGSGGSGEVEEARLCSCRAMNFTVAPSRPEAKQEKHKRSSELTSYSCLTALNNEIRRTDAGTSHRLPHYSPTNPRRIVSILERSKPMPVTIHHPRPPASICMRSPSLSLRRRVRLVYAKMHCRSARRVTRPIFPSCMNARRLFSLEGGEHEELCEDGQSQSSTNTQGQNTHVVRRRNGYAVLLRMPAHVQNLLVEVDLIGVGLFAHALRAAGGRVRARSFLAAGTRRAVHRRGDADLLRLEGALVGLQHHLRVLALFRRVDHEVVVVAASHDVLRIAGEDYFKLVEDAIVLVGIA